MFRRPTARARRPVSSRGGGPGLPPELAFPGLQLLWRGSDGKSLTVDELDTWDSTLGAGGPETLEGAYLYSDQKPRSAPTLDYAQLRAPSGDSASIGMELFAATLQQSNNSDAYFACCFALDTDADSDTDLSLGAYHSATFPDNWVYFGANNGVVYASCRHNFVEKLRTEAPSSVGLHKAELWSDAVNLNARINGGAFASAPWAGSGSRWVQAYDSVDMYIASLLGVKSARVYEWLIARGAYAGDAACRQWRRWCDVQYGRPDVPFGFEVITNGGDVVTNNGQPIYVAVP